MTATVPAEMPNAFRVTLVREFGGDRLDNLLLEALRGHSKDVSRTGLKSLFNAKKVFIKGQRAKSSSTLAKGTTYVDVLGV